MPESESVDPVATKLPSYATELIESIAKKEGFSDYAVVPTSGSNHGDGFLGIMYRVSIEGQRKIEGTLKHDKLSLLCKMPPEDKQRRALFFTASAFEREVYSYDVLLPAIVKFQEEKGISQEDGFFQFPKCYGTFSDPENGDYVIVMEDLREIGYEMWNKFDKLTVDHAKLLLSTLGRYHAISFGIRDQRPELFNDFRKIKPDLLLKMFEAEQTRIYVGDNYEMAANSLEPDETILRQKILNLKETFFDKMSECCIDGVAEPFSVMNHGDCWNNNMMYRYYERSKIPKRICLIDWQVVQFCSPAMDLSYFLYSSTEKSLRDNHYDDLIRVYYDSLSEMLRRLGSDPEKLFTFGNLQNQLQRFARYGFIMAPQLLQVITANADDIPDLDEMSQKMTANDVDALEGFVKKDNPIYKERMSNAIRDFFKKNYDL